MSSRLNSKKSREEEVTVMSRRPSNCCFPIHTCVMTPRHELSTVLPLSQLMRWWVHWFCFCFWFYGTPHRQSSRDSRNAYEWLEKNFNKWFFFSWLNLTLESNTHLSTLATTNASLPLSTATSWTQPKEPRSSPQHHSDPAHPSFGPEDPSADGNLKRKSWR